MADEYLSKATSPGAPGLARIRIKRWRVAYRVLLAVLINCSIGFADSPGDELPSDARSAIASFERANNSNKEGPLKAIDGLIDATTDPCIQIRLKDEKARFEKCGICPQLERECYEDIDGKVLEELVAALRTYYSKRREAAEERDRSLKKSLESARQRKQEEVISRLEAINDLDRLDTAKLFELLKVGQKWDDVKCDETKDFPVTLSATVTKIEGPFFHLSTVYSEGDNRFESEQTFRFLFGGSNPGNELRLIHTSGTIFSPHSTVTQYDAKRGDICIRFCHKRIELFRLLNVKPQEINGTFRLPVSIVPKTSN